MLHALIMAGGGGTRFWPRSRKRRPKQFLALAGDRTLIQQAFDRIEGSVAAQHTWVITAEEHRTEVGRELPDVPPTHIIGEPCGRDTAACIGLGAALIARRDPAAVMLVLPADHMIEPAQEFRRAVHVAAGMAEENPQAFVTFGIVPSYPATGYGYIHRGPAIGARQAISAFRVQSFREKPNSDLAEQFVASGEYFWNSGIFVWRAGTILDALRQRQPALATAVDRIAHAWGTPEHAEVFKREYEPLQKISIDYAVMEHAREVFVVQAPFRWDDVGSWLALERLHPQDANHNTVLARHTGLNTRGCVIVGDAAHLIATAGVENLVIVQDGDALLVAGRDAEGLIKRLVEQMKATDLEKYL